MVTTSLRFVPSLEAAALVVKSIYEQEIYEALVEHIRVIQTTLENYKPQEDEFKEAYQKYIDTLKKIEKHIKQLRKPGKFSQRYRMEILKFINPNKDEQLFKQFTDALTQAINAFHLEVGVQMFNEISKQSEVLAELTNIVKGVNPRPSAVIKTSIDHILITDYPLEKKDVVSRRKALVKKIFRGQPVAVRRLVSDYSELDEIMRDKLENELVIRNFFFHGANVLHHNIGTKNVLLDEHLTAKRSNFDTSRFTHQTTTTIPGLRDGLDFGMTLWEIAANGKSPFSEIEYLELEYAIISGTRPLIPDDTPPAFEKLIREVWEEKWNKRPKIDVIAENLYINYQSLVEGNSQIKN
ncbi:5740_t:CDS:2 [Ambispora gerdemannii]|uniref:5740_t:CDS:1 n=1 Tax=Ambispora gerdemannii TaxID=144530 RepID=A0A9N9BQE3_9GLOM|nr:5740_t:CDS:2 [Ambispora gerdemannii]